MVVATGVFALGFATVPRRGTVDFGLGVEMDSANINEGPTDLAHPKTPAELRREDIRDNLGTVSACHDRRQRDVVAHLHKRQ